MYNVEYLIAHRTAQSDRSSRSSVMTRIAVITVALGVAAILLTLAVVRGFRREMYADLRGFNADISIVDVAVLSGSERRLPYSESLVERCAAVEGVQSVAPYVVVGGMAKCGDNVLGLQIKGIDSTYDTSWWQSRLVEGELPDFAAAQRGREILLSRSTASQLEVGVGDKVEMLFVEGGSRPRRDAFKVVGLYHTGLEEMDRAIALGDVRDVRRVASISSDEVSGYDVAIADDRKTERIAEALDEEIFVEAQSNERYISTVAATLQRRHPVIFDWMKAHTVIARAVIIIMMVVLLFNMAAAMLIMVFDRIGMIGVLKAQGMRTSAIRRVFLYRAALIFAQGALWGNIIGGVLIAMQWHWQVVRLNPAGYMLSVLPVDVGWWWLWLNVGALSIAVAVMVLPSMLVAGVMPERSLRYKL
ncbi:MAG: ABC transporter permease [Alistipes sp.]|nr:ABC transporter permease [Alistipes sp.]